MPTAPGPPGSPDLSAARRAHELSTTSRVDVLVVGGGITGAGVALDAASRGLSVALVERGDLASGTSRWSSKLVHGGLRYLATGALGIALESARERHVLMTRTAPHLVRPMQMVVPVTDGLAGRHLVEAGCWTGDLLRLAAGTRRATLPRPRRLSAVETARLLPALDQSRLTGGFAYWDGQLEDDARLVVAVARTAAAHGARVLTRVRAERLDGAGADLVDVLSGERLRIDARHVVNATGVWASSLTAAVALRPSKGSHVVLPAAALGHPRAAMTVRVPGTTNRYVFALPQPDGICLVGLTDDPYDGEPPDTPVAGEADEDFLLATLSAVLRRPLGRADLLTSFAGLRPLLTDASRDPADTADLSRRHALVEDDRGVLTIVGGKLTTYRRMAADTVDRIAARPGVRCGPCRTAGLPLVGAAATRDLAAQAEPARLVRRYGAEAGRVAALHTATTAAELAFGVTAEGALTVEDLLDRRLRLDLQPELRERALPLAEQALAAAPA